MADIEKTYGCLTRNPDTQRDAWAPKSNVLTTMLGMLPEDWTPFGRSRPETSILLFPQRNQGTILKVSWKTKQFHSDVNGLVEIKSRIHHGQSFPASPLLGHGAQLADGSRGQQANCPFSLQLHCGPLSCTIDGKHDQRKTT